jgi:phospholipase C
VDVTNLSRRDLLKGGAIAGAGLASSALLPGPLLRALAGAPACGKLSDIEHIVILIQENRSFDHYFGRYKGVRGFDDTSVNRSVFSQHYGAGLEPLTMPNPLLPFHLDTAITLPPHAGECTNDIDHQWIGQHHTWNGGANDRWMSSHIATNGPTGAPVTMGYYEGSPRRDHSGDVDLYWALADNFTILDNYYCSTIGGTDINRLHSISGTMDPDGWDGGLQFIDTQVSKRANFAGALGKKGKWVPYPEVLSRHGVSWKVYSTPSGTAGDNVLGYFKDFTNPTSPLFLQAFGNQAFPVDFLTQFRTDCLLGQLPSVSWLLADLLDTEHAPAPIEWGQDIVHQVLSCMVDTGIWSKTALIITWDENGGFFDHVSPPVAPTGTPGEYLAHDTAAGDSGGILGPIGLGFRVPAIVVSPFSRNPNPSGKPLVCSDPFDHTSLIRLIESRFGVPIPNRDPSTQTPGLSPWRRAAVGDMTSAFNFAAAPNHSAPKLPATSHLDPRVLAECITTGEFGSLASQTAPIAQGYPVPTVAHMPTQEQPPGYSIRPSGPC